MKSTPKKQSKSPFSFRNDKKPIRQMAIFMAICVLNLSVSCNYYKVKKLPITQDNIVQTIQEFNMERNYAVINQSLHLANLVINEDERSISGIVQFPSDEHRSPQLQELGKTYRYKKAQRQPFNELHFKVNSTIDPTIGTNFTLNFSDIQSISVNDPNTGRSIIAFVASAVGIFFATVLIIAALKSSCPFVYVKNGEEFVFKGELYPGIITPKMQRLDYLSLGILEPQNGELTIKVTNELREIQYTDFLQLWVAQHPAGLKLALDQNAELQSFSKLKPPVKMSNLSGAVAAASLLAADDQFYTFNNDIPTSESTRELTLEFDKPAEAKTAKLLLTAKNSLWLDYVFGKFNEQFGSYYNTFQKDQQEVPKEQGEAWIKNQHIPLSVYLKTAKGWELMQQINTVGPMATRDLAISLPLAKLTGDKVEIKLKCGFMFWELDYAGMDFTENQPFSVNKVDPDIAIDETGQDVTSLLNTIDQQYLVQPNIGNEVTVSFKAAEAEAGFVQSAFLINKGYYNYIRDYNGIPNFNKLKTFRENLAFTRYSENMYKTIMAFDQPLDLASNE